ncbi:MAG: tetratricopeptide repeat protein [Actinomycetes bacterium]
MTQPGFSAYGAVDLSALSSPQAGASGADASRSGGASGAVVVEVTEANFQAEVIERSMSVPVVLDFWAEWCEPCKQLSPVLEKLAGEGGGRWVLATVDTDANQRLAQAFGVQGIPAVKAVVGGQLVDLFTGAYPEAQIRQVLDELLKVAAQQGLTGSAEADVQPGQDDEPAEQAEPLRHPEAQEALERDDLEAAEAAYRKALDTAPADEEARVGLARVRLMIRTRDADPQQVRASAAERPDDVAAQTAAADMDVVGGHVEDAFARLVDTVRRTSGDDRNAARQHLVELFEVVGQQDPLVVKARGALANALY